MKRLLSFILCLVISSTLFAQVVRQAFVNMPDSILSILTKVNREDCIDFLDSHMKAVIKNRFDQKSEMTTLSNDFLRMQLSTNSSFEMKILPTTDTTHVICTIQTVCSKVCDSHIKFYTINWQPLDSKDYIILPKQTEFEPDSIPSFIADTLSTSWPTLHAEADILLMQATLADTTSHLVFHYTTPNYMRKESAALYTSLLKSHSIIYEWQKGKFIRKD